MKIYSHITINDDFDDKSLIVMLKSSVSKYKGIDERVNELFNSVGAVYIEDITALHDSSQTKYDCCLSYP